MDESLFRDRGWDVIATYGHPPILDEIDSDPDSPGISDVGTKNMLYSLVLSMKPHRIVEIGSHIGSAAIVILQALKLNKFGKLFAIEPQSHYFSKLNQYIEKAKLTDYVRTLQGFSYDKNIFATLKYEAPFQIIYIDACHNKTDVVRELNDYYPLLDNNGLFILHDSSKHAQEFDSEKKGGVRDAIIEVCSSLNNLLAIFFEHPIWLNPCGLAIIAKQNIVNHINM